MRGNGESEGRRHLLGNANELQAGRAGAKVRRYLRLGNGVEGTDGEFIRLFLGKTAVGHGSIVPVFVLQRPAQFLHAEPDAGLDGSKRLTGLESYDSRREGQRK